MQIRRITLSLVAAGALVLTACGSDDPAPQNTDPGVATTETFVVDTPIAEPSGDPAGGTQQNFDEVNAWVLAAIETAEAHAGGAAVSVDDEDNDQAWEVDVVVGDRVHEVKVNLEGTEVIEDNDTDDADDDDRQAEAGGLAAAIEAAVAHTPGVVDGAELEEDDGNLRYKVDLDGTADGDDVELRVDPASNEVTLDD